MEPFDPFKPVTVSAEFSVIEIVNPTLFNKLFSGPPLTVNWLKTGPAQVTLTMPAGEEISKSQAISAVAGLLPYVDSIIVIAGTVELYRLRKVGEGWE